MLEAGVSEDEAVLNGGSVGLRQGQRAKVRLCLKGGLRLSNLLPLVFLVLAFPFSVFGDISSKSEKVIGEPGDLAAELSAVVKGGGREGLALLVQDVTVPGGADIYSLHADASLKPASVLKVLTSLAALELLGPNYRFTTRVYADRNERGRVNTLYVQGNGDPGLTIESAWAMARGLKRRGLQSVNTIVVDSTRFEGDRRPQGQRAYQTGSSALSFNYNAFSFEVCPGAPGSRASVVPDPFELKIPLVGTIVTKKGSGGTFSIEQALPNASQAGILSYRLKGSIGSQQGCSTVYRSMPNPGIIFGSTFAEVLRSIGVNVNPSGVKEGSTPAELDALFVQESAPLSQIVRDLNHFSNNFIAEQILFALGQTELGTYSRERGLERLRAFLASLGFDRSSFELRDASGLSHENRVSARMIAAVLARALRNQEVAPEFESSLAVGERSGTLKKRPFDSQGVVLRGKTGTLDGVTSLAGYVVGASGRKYAFVIFQNGVASVARGHEFEDKVVRVLSRN